jgi:hypothetical protein
LGRPVACLSNPYAGDRGSPGAPAWAGSGRCSVLHRRCKTAGPGRWDSGCRTQSTCGRWVAFPRVLLFVPPNWYIDAGFGQACFLRSLSARSPFPPFRHGSVERWTTNLSSLLPVNPVDTMHVGLRKRVVSGKLLGEDQSPERRSLRWKKRPAEHSIP